MESSPAAAGKLQQTGSRERSGDDIGRDMFRQPVFGPTPRADALQIPQSIQFLQEVTRPLLGGVQEVPTALVVDPTACAREVQDPLFVGAEISLTGAAEIRGH